MCANELIVTGSPENLLFFASKVWGYGEAFSLERILPKLGGKSTNSLDWKSENWGIKSDCQEVVVDIEHNQSIPTGTGDRWTYYFLTPDTPFSFGFFRKLVEKFSKVNFELHYAHKHKEVIGKYDSLTMTSWSKTHNLFVEQEEDEDPEVAWQKFHKHRDEVDQVLLPEYKIWERLWNQSD